ncbi:hypothetical protein [Nocardioides ungokensis]|uniref:hypothetical protein n=1 Tax=Nocardioides ungokensis TaxID=1643322 RepID=UPI0015E00250|nr:hypothetical protein [Nocardioides ungokensis]
MVGALASLALLTGVFVLGLVAFFAVYVGAPSWTVAVAVGAVLVGFGAAFKSLRSAVTR